MKVALVNNGTKHLVALHELLRDHEVQNFDFSEANNVTGVDLIVLSGGSEFPILESEGKLDAEINLIRTTTTPLIGICYGCELIAHALGGTLSKVLGEKVSGLQTIRVTVDDPIFQGQKEFQAYEAHRWVIEKVPEELEVLAESEYGPEIIRHKTRPLWGFQFHPEKTTVDSLGNSLFSAVVTSLVKAV